MKKKAYIQPQSIDTHLQVRLLVDASGNNTYGSNDPAGKERDDTEAAEEEETDAWTNGLW